MNVEFSKSQNLVDEKSAIIIQKDTQISDLKSMLMEYENLNAQVETKLQANNQNESSLKREIAELLKNNNLLQDELKLLQQKQVELLNSLKL